MKKKICLALLSCVILFLPVRLVQAQPTVPQIVHSINKTINVYEDTTIVLENVTYQSESPAIAVHNNAKLTLVLKGKSVIEHTSGDPNAMYSGIFLDEQSQIAIVDDSSDNEMGSLELKNWDFGICSYANDKNGSIQVEGVSLNIDSKQGGICIMNGEWNEISIRNAQVSVKNTEFVGIGSYFGGELNNLSIENSTIDVDSKNVGIGSDRANLEQLSINNSKFKVLAEHTGIGGLEAKISGIIISNSVGSVKVTDSLNCVGIGMVTGEVTTQGGCVRVYKMDELALKNNYLLVDSPVTCIGAARKIIPSGEKGTAIISLSIQGGLIATKSDGNNGVAVGAKDLNIENIYIQDACLAVESNGPVLGRVESQTGESTENTNQLTSIFVKGQSQLIAGGNELYAQTQNDFQKDEQAKFDANPVLTDSDLEAAMNDLERTMENMSQPGNTFFGNVGELKKQVGGESNLGKLLHQFEDIILPVAPGQGNSEVMIVDSESIIVDSEGNIVKEPERWVPTTADEIKRYAFLGKEAVKYNCPKTNPYELKIFNAMQGPKCFVSFEAVLGDYTMGRTYNIYPDGQAAYNKEQKATISLAIPKDLQKEGRNFQMICVTEGGLPILLKDLDKNPETITFETDKFYAFALIYK